MKILKFALLSSAMLSLVGCGNSNCKITFSGENCFIRNEAGEEFTTLNVSKNSAVNLQIFIKEEAKYLVPDSSRVTITEGVEYNYYQSSTTDGKHKAGDLIISNIDRDITITATARNRSAVTYSVEYPHDPNANWNGPTEVNSGDQLDATIEITKETYFITKSDINVRIGNNYFYDDFTFIDNKLTIPAGAINGKVVITGLSHRPGATYNVAFNVSNAEKDVEFPTVVKEGASLTATFTAKKGYRLPRIIDGNPQHDEFSIHKKGSNVDMSLTPFDPDTWNGDFTYRITIKDGIEHGEVYIFPGVLVNSNFDTVSFEGDAVEQVTVTFEPGAKEGGHWQNPVSSTESRDGTIDIGDTLGNALAKASGGEEPTKDGDQWSFDKWVDDSGTEYYSPTEIDKSVTVHATFKEKEFTIYKEEVYHAEIIGLPTTPLHWHDPVGSSLKPIKFKTEDGYKLPAKGLVSVTMNKPEDTHWYDINFHYIRMTDTEADFYIDEGIIEGDIKIALNAEKYVTVTFNPGEGKWKDGTQDVVPVTIPVGSTYGEALDLTRKGGNPSKAGAKFFNWMDGDTIITTDEIIDESDEGRTVTAIYTTITTFANDTWANVIAHADADDLKDAYGETIYIGATRKVTWANEAKTVTKEYTVRVIDSDYDYYYKDDKHEETVASALTFEFVDLVGEGIYGKMPDKALGKNSWFDSNYRAFLEEFYEGIHRGTPDFTVKPAIKYTLHGYVAPNENIDPRDQYETINNFFPLSGAEIGLAADNKRTNNTTYSPDQRVNEALPVSGGLAYYYYQNQTASRLKELDGVATSYWLRSPHVYKEDGMQDPDKPDTSEAYWIDLTSGESSKTGSPTDYNGGRGGSSTCDNSYGYMAAFCI